MRATLPMYDWPEVRSANDAFWASVRRHLATAGIDAPVALSRAEDLAADWSAPDLVLGQTCGYPFVLGLCGSSEVVARPTYSAEGCGPGTYRSAFVVRRGAGGDGLANLRGARVAVNDWQSQSGFNALAHAIAGLPASDGPFFSRAMVTGGHRMSARAVASGAANIAAIDCVSWELFRRFEPEAAAALEVAGWSAECPALPFITAPAEASRRSALVAALAAACAEQEPHPAIPVSVLPANGDDYAAVAAMAAISREVDFAPEAPRL